MTNDCNEQYASINDVITSQRCKQFASGVKQLKEMGCVGCGKPHNTDACPRNKESIMYVNKIKANKVVKMNTTMKHLTITKGTTTTDHTIIHLNNNKIRQLLHPHQ